MKEYFDKDAVGDDHGVASNAYKFAETYFNGFSGSNIKPSSLFIASYVNADKAAALIGRSLRSTTPMKSKRLTAHYLSRLTAL